MCILDLKIYISKFYFSTFFKNLYIWSFFIINFSNFFIYLITSVITISIIIEGIKIILRYSLFLSSNNEINVQNNMSLLSPIFKLLYHIFEVLQHRRQTSSVFFSITSNTQVNRQSIRLEDAINNLLSCIANWKTRPRSLKRAMCHFDDISRWFATPLVKLIPISASWKITRESTTISSHFQINAPLLVVFHYHVRGKLPSRLVVTFTFQYRCPSYSAIGATAVNRGYAEHRVIWNAS